MTNLLVLLGHTCHMSLSPGAQFNCSNASCTHTTNRIRSCVGTGRRCAVYAEGHHTSGSGTAGSLNPFDHFHLPELLSGDSSPSGAAQRNAGARRAAMPPPIAKEGIATWVSVLSRLSGEPLLCSECCRCPISPVILQVQWKRWGPSTNGLQSISWQGLWTMWSVRQQRPMFCVCILPPIM